MIIYSICNACLQCYELRVEPSEVSIIKQISDEEGESCPCPRLCGGRINLIGNSIEYSAVKKYLPITGTELFQAVNGLGLPDEIQVSKEVVYSILKTNPAIDFDLEESNNKIYLHEIHLANGLTLHLAAGVRGAHVLKITKRREHVDSESGRGSGQGRTQIGSTP